ncbi:ATP-binding protein [Rhizobium leguminosarum]|uniref:ATP-binding protein n=1 Tax=Rhizobium leguminosarum TaxID=384 RepID=UPI001C94E606|nr:ATP-binding protein [Rhizobium leguminosarum]MBY5324446.1 ATP-binding protein [Rhizobium leguminosarum]MBY5385726.1 ATP-binding protein [Rhizobium leguminosarum]MCA2436040.1 ATP-binding protein [Rhizobium leguminosarum]
MFERSYTASDIEERRRRADARLRATMDPAAVQLADRMDAIRKRNCSTPRDDLVKGYLDAMKRSLISRNGEKKAKILFIVGESNAGKSRLIENAIAGDPAFHSYDDEDGHAKQLLRTTTPSPCTQRNFAIRFVKDLGFPVKDDIRKTRAWPLLEDQIRFHRVRWAIVDEAQRMMKVDNPSDLQEVSDNLISLVDAVDWPIRLVVLGVPPLAELRRRDKQMEERSEIIELSPVPAAKTSRVEIWLTEIIVDHAGLAMRRADFTRGNIVLVAEKLIHGCAGNAGSIIEHIRSAVEVTIRADRTEVVIADFAQAYYNRTRCLPHDNIFEVSTWKAVPGGAAKIKEPIETKPELGDQPEQQVDDNAGFKKPKTGDRPR